MTDSKVYDAIKQSQSTKEEPLIFIITTEGTTVGGFLDMIRTHEIRPLWVGYDYGIVSTRLKKWKT